MEQRLKWDGGASAVALADNHNGATQQALEFLQQRATVQRRPSSAKSRSGAAKAARSERSGGVSSRTRSARPSSQLKLSGGGGTAKGRARRREREASAGSKGGEDAASSPAATSRQSGVPARVSSGTASVRGRRSRAGRGRQGSSARSSAREAGSGAKPEWVGVADEAGVDVGDDVLGLSGGMEVSYGSKRDVDPASEVAKVDAMQEEIARLREELRERDEIIATLTAPRRHDGHSESEDASYTTEARNSMLVSQVQQLQRRVLSLRNANRALQCSASAAEAALSTMAERVQAAEDAARDVGGEASSPAGRGMKRILEVPGAFVRECKRCIRNIADARSTIRGVALEPLVVGNNEFAFDGSVLSFGQVYGFKESDADAETFDAIARHTRTSLEHNPHIRVDRVKQLEQRLSVLGMQLSRLTEGLSEPLNALYARSVTGSRGADIVDELEAATLALRRCAFDLTALGILLPSTLPAARTTLPGRHEATVPTFKEFTRHLPKFGSNKKEGVAHIRQLLSDCRRRETALENEVHSMCTQLAVMYRIVDVQRGFVQKLVRDLRRQWSDAIGWVKSSVIPALSVTHDAEDATVSRRLETIASEGRHRAEESARVVDAALNDYDSRISELTAQLQRVVSATKVSREPDASSPSGASSAPKASELTPPAADSEVPSGMESPVASRDSRVSSGARGAGDSERSPRSNSRPGVAVAQQYAADEGDEGEDVGDYGSHVKVVGGIGAASPASPGALPSAERPARAYQWSAVIASPASPAPPPRPPST